MKRIPEHSGQLNYLISALLIAYVREHGVVSYHTCNEVMGVLASVQAEFYRRVVAPLEDLKIRANGDLPWPTAEEELA